MTAAWVLYVLLVGGLLAGAALAVDGAVRRTAMPSRWIWAGALAGCVVLALVAPRERAAGPLSNALVNVTQGQVHLSPSPAPLSFVAATRAAQALVASSLSRVVGLVGSRVPPAARTLLAALWLAVSASLLAWLVAVNGLVDRARRSWPHARVHGTPVRVAPGTGPAVVGFTRPEIVVPRWLLARSDEEQRIVVVHEHEHMAAGDQLVLTGAWVVAALLPWHPAVWWMLSRLRLAIEVDCDARVLLRGVSPRPYGALLIDIAGQCAGLRHGALALADRTTHLERRLLAMTPIRSRLASARAASLVAVAVLFVVAACESRMPTQAEVASMDAASAERTAVKGKLLAENGPAPVYIVDGKTVTAAEAKAIASSDIVSIDVTRSTTKEPSQIAIHTRYEPAEPGASDATSAAAVKRKLVLAGTQGDSGRTTLIMRQGVRFSETVAVKVATDPAKRIAEKKAVADQAFRGVVVIDGTKSTPEAMSALTPESIASVSVLKGDAARAASSDPAAEYGVIVITLLPKKTAAP